jgi:Domain of unknown function (DUF4129)
MFSGWTGTRVLRFALPALLILLVLAGLRGTTNVPGWSGRYTRDGVPIGIALEILIGVLLVALLIRGRWAKPGGYVAARLQGPLRYLLGAGLVAIPVVMLLSHWHPHPGTQKIKPGTIKGHLRKLPVAKPVHNAGSFPLDDVLYGLLVALLLAAAVVCWWVVRNRLANEEVWEPGPGADEPAELGAAVESGRAALMRLDDARAAIIACYLAMEQSLAEAGAARAVAETPDELLARAVAAGLASIGAASRLTALFYEARFSTHPLGPAHRDEAGQALTEIAAGIERLRPSETAGSRGTPGAQG